MAETKNPQVNRQIRQHLPIRRIEPGKGGIAVVIQQYRSAGEMVKIVVDGQKPVRSDRDRRKTHRDNKQGQNQPSAGPISTVTGRKFVEDSGRHRSVTAPREIRCAIAIAGDRRMIYCTISTTPNIFVFLLFTLWDSLCKGNIQCVILHHCSGSRPSRICQRNRGRGLRPRVAITVSPVAYESAPVRPWNSAKRLVKPVRRSYRSASRHRHIRVPVERCRCRPTL